VLSIHATRTRSVRFSASSRRSFAVALLAAACGIARASVLAATPDCSASGDSFECSLLGFLHFLYATAGLLAIVLIVVVSVAIHIYRKNKDSAEDDQ
jgi:hypothetical protein